jgi:hypothetical protein
MNSKQPSVSALLSDMMSFLSKNPGLLPRRCSSNHTQDVNDSQLLQQSSVPQHYEPDQQLREPVDLCYQPILRNYANSSLSMGRWDMLRTVFEVDLSTDCYKKTWIKLCATSGF